MTTDGTPGTGNPTPIPAASGGANTGGTLSATPAQATDGRFQPREWRYPADYHVTELRGRTADEAAGYFKTFYTQALANQPAQRQAPAPAAAEPDDTDWLSSPSQTFKKASQSLVESRLEPAMAQLYRANAQTSIAMLKDRYADVFDKWRPEVDALVMQLDPQYQTFENLERIVKMVRSEHNDEIIQSRLDSEVQKRIQAMGGTLRADGTVAAPSAAEAPGVDFKSAELPEEYRQILQSVGLKPRDLPDFLRNYYGPNADLEKAQKDWFEKAKAGRVVTESRAGWRMERR